MNVDYNKKNLERCLCVKCPVQMESLCAYEGKLSIVTLLKNLKETDLMPDPNLIAGLYCSIGKSKCGDLNTEQQCQCNRCPVFKEYSLQTGYYCKLGKEE